MLAPTPATSRTDIETQLQPQAQWTARARPLPTPIVFTRATEKGKRKM